MKEFVKVWHIWWRNVLVWNEFHEVCWIVGFGVKEWVVFCFIFDYIIDLCHRVSFVTHFTQNLAYLFHYFQLLMQIHRFFLTYIIRKSLFNKQFIVVGWLVIIFLFFDITVLFVAVFRRWEGRDLVIITL
jgi:hypothetical protein